MLKPLTLIVVTLAVVGSIVHQDPAFANATTTVTSVTEGKLKQLEGREKTLASRSSRPGTVVIRIKLGTPTHNKIYAKFLILDKYGWGKKQYRCLVNLWNKESGWSHLSKNSDSGAYGIPQSLPAKKMATEGKDWKTNPATQIKWGVKYIKDRYTTPCAAYAHFKSKNWY